MFTRHFLDYFLLYIIFFKQIYELFLHFKHMTEVSLKFKRFALEFLKADHLKRMN